MHPTHSLIQDAVNGDASNFVRGDFVATAWRLFDPFLAAAEAPGAPPPLPYAHGSRGPAAADEQAQREGFRRSEGYTWRESKRA
jgi:glucose-6-phosphate 1-dehydrogenase